MSQTTSVEESGTDPQVSDDGVPGDEGRQGAEASDASRSGRQVRPGLRTVEPGARIGAHADDAVVCIPVYKAYDDFARCLHSVLANTPPDTLILVADDGSPGVDVHRTIADVDRGGQLRHEVVFARGARNVGFVENMNRAFEATTPADIVILNSDCVVGECWLEGLRAAAYSDTLIATATALTNNGTIVSVPERNRPTAQLPAEWTAEQAAAAVRAQSLCLYPRIPVAIGHCVYIKRTALDLVGSFDTVFSPGYGEEVDFSLRCVRRGLSHVVADDVFVLHSGAGSFGHTARHRIKEEHERIIEARYPLYPMMHRVAAEERHTPFARSIGVARRALKGLSVAVDATCLGPAVTGTQVHALELIHGLWREGGAHLRVIIPKDIGSYARRRLEAMDGLALQYLHEVDWDAQPADVVHRPYQLSTLREITVLRRLGDRVVITQQDMIAFRNPSYFLDFPSWERYRMVARQALNIADLVFFFTHHAARDAMADGLVDEARARVVNIGADHCAALGGTHPEPPRWAEALQGREFILCLGTDFYHKNRLFALQVLDQLQRRHHWRGVLLLAGARVAEGSSAGEEARFLMLHPEVDRATLRMGNSTEAEKEWLYRKARAVLYPTTYEGFGLIPFEAAAAGVPCIFAPQASLEEVLPGLATIVPWKPGATADRVIRLITDEGNRRELTEAIAEAGRRYTWEQTAKQALALYWEAASAAPRATPGMDTIDSPLTVLAYHLVGEGGALSADVQQALWAVARRPTLGRAFNASLVGVHRAGLRVLNSRRRHLSASGSPDAWLTTRAVGRRERAVEGRLDAILGDKAPRDIAEGQ